MARIKIHLYEEQEKFAKWKWREDQKKWPHFDDMQFIDQYIKDRDERISNISIASFAPNTLDDSINSDDTGRGVLEELDDYGDVDTLYSQQSITRSVESPTLTADIASPPPTPTLTPTPIADATVRDRNRARKRQRSHEKAANDEIGNRLAAAIEAGAASLAQPIPTLELSKNEKFGHVIAGKLSHLTDYQQVYAKQQIFSVLRNVRFAQQGLATAPAHTQDISYINL
uniref:Uncharacterized protein n=1 Tax=Plectus sambesii TaxID=2011161 RepID=A0A914UKA0_9BILA